MADTASIKSFVEDWASEAAGKADSTDTAAGYKGLGLFNQFVSKYKEHLEAVPAALRTMFISVPLSVRPPPEAMMAAAPPAVKLMTLVSAARLEELKKEAAATLPRDSGVPFISANDALVARLWQVGPTWDLCGTYV